MNSNNHDAPLTILDNPELYKKEPMSNEDRIEKIREDLAADDYECDKGTAVKDDLKLLLAQLTAAKPALELYEAVKEFKKYLANEINWCAKNYDASKGTPEGKFHAGTLRALTAAEEKFNELSKQVAK